MEKDENLQELVITVKLVNNFNVDEQFLLDVLNSLGDHLIPVNNITLNGLEVFDSKFGFNRANFKSNNM